MGNFEAYDFQFNGVSTDLTVSMDKILLSDNWDYITIQQASYESFDWQKYEPYIRALAEHIRLLCPRAKLGIHETWAYSNIERLNKFGFENPMAMYEKVKSGKSTLEKMNTMLNAGSFKKQLFDQMVEGTYNKDEVVNKIDEDIAKLETEIREPYRHLEEVEYKKSI